MTHPSPAAPPLTDEQRAVVEQPWDARLLVMAGAGSGKTHTVVRRLDHLVGGDDPEEALEAGEILVLSFSRAAVRELTERIARHGERANRVRARTFDAWALDLLLRTYPDAEWHAESFETRIAAAVKAVAAGALEVTEEGPPAHVLIDEAQDLVGERRNLVETLLDRHQEELGFTIVGDSAQGIYGFQVSPENRVAENGWFIDWLRGSYPDDLVELELTANFRSRTAEARTALPLSGRVQRLGGSEAEVQSERLYRELSDEILDLLGFDSLDDELFLMALRDNPTPTAILTRDNRQALMVSEKLRDHGVPHTLKRRLEDRFAPGWFADLCARTDASVLARSRFVTLFAQLSPHPGIEGDEAWRVLLRHARAGSGRAEQIDLARMRELIGAGRFPEELAPVDTAPLTVSTIHRAKGLEYDRVVLLDPPNWSALPNMTKGQVDPVAEVRGLYVAMTRARDQLLHVPGPEVRQLRTEPRSGRAYLGGWQRWERYGLQLRGRDVRRDVPPGHDADAEPASVQEYLRGAVRPGDPVTLLAPLRLPEGDGQSPRYLIVHGEKERIVGEVSESFRRELHAVRKVSDTWEIRDWPERIVGGHVDCLEAVGGAASVAADCKVAGNGVWTAVRLAGLARFAGFGSDDEEKA
ncbi:UvrD-helicase domain-containing protein [Streptomyces sp. PU-14G]|uniref:UvrD-helicase domain-containing protein n=1 Tax=Streptomyces sp. PU-14G TaxID=2800808 RepID=UPI0034DEE08B